MTAEGWSSARSSSLQAVEKFGDMWYLKKVCSVRSVLGEAYGVHLRKSCPHLGQLGSSQAHWYVYRLAWVCSRHGTTVRYLS
jgi:hypothetical protein